jgi:hypothetical protein
LAPIAPDFGGCAFGKAWWDVWFHFAWTAFAPRKIGPHISASVHDFEQKMLVSSDPLLSIICHFVRTGLSHMAHFVALVVVMVWPV